MATRNFIQQGKAFGSVGATVTVTMDGLQVYSGPVPTDDTPLPPMPPGDDPALEATLFSWTLPAEFVGPIAVSISVEGSPVILDDTLADWTLGTDLTAPAEFGRQVISGTAVGDPFSDVSIDGEAQVRSVDPSGQWTWVVPAGSTFTATLNVIASPFSNYPQWDAATVYPSPSNVIYNNACYAAFSGAAAGLVPPDNPKWWAPLPVEVWDIDNSYDIWTRVVTALIGGQVYHAIQNVPPGIALTDTNYWSDQIITD